LPILIKARFLVSLFYFVFYPQPHFDRLNAPPKGGFRGLV